MGNNFDIDIEDILRADIEVDLGEYIGSAVSPRVDIQDTDDGHVVTITDKWGDHSYTVPDWSNEEQARVEAERLRAVAEQGRVEAETARNGAEMARATAESGRTTAETDRVEAEQARASEWTELKADAQSATDAANEAAGSANANIKRLLGNVLKGKLDGEILTADDAYSAPAFDYVIDGKSTQDGTPTPESPIDIVSVDELALAFANKQLMDWSHPFRTGSYSYDIAIGTILEPATSGNVEVTMNNGTLVSVIKAGWNGAIWRSPNLPNGTYHIYFPIATISDNTGTSVGTTLFVVDKNNKCVRKIGTHATTGNWNHIITLSGDEAAICVNAGTRSGTHGTYTYSMPQLEAGAVATVYQNYDAIIANIPMQGNVLRSLSGGTKDTLALQYLRPSTRDGWAWYAAELVQRVGTVIFDETENWRSYNYASGAGYYTSTKLQNIGHKSMGYKLCNIASEGVGGASGENTFYFGGAREVNFVDVSTAAPTLADWIALVTVTPAVVLYEFATPITHDLGEVELPALFGPNSTIWADPTTGLQVTYERDLTIAIGNIETAIADT